MYSPCLSAIGGGQPLSSPMRHSLGKPLPYQLADAVQASQEAACAFTPEVLSCISTPFGELFMTLGCVPMYYYLVRH